MLSDNIRFFVLAIMELSILFYDSEKFIRSVETYD